MGLYEGGNVGAAENDGTKLGGYVGDTVGVGSTGAGVVTSALVGDKDLGGEATGEGVPTGMGAKGAKVFSGDEFGGVVGIASVGKSAGCS